MTLRLSRFIQHALSSHLKSMSLAEFSFPVYGGVLNVIEYLVSLGFVDQERVENGMAYPKREQILAFVKNICIPWLALDGILQSAYPLNVITNLCTTVVYGAFYYVWLGLFVAAAVRNDGGLQGFGWLAFVLTGILLGSIRNGFRKKYNIRSNVVGDGLASLFAWPQVLGQMQEFDTSEKSNEKWF